MNESEQQVTSPPPQEDSKVQPAEQEQKESAGPAQRKKAFSLVRFFMVPVLLVLIGAVAALGYYGRLQQNTIEELLAGQSQAADREQELAQRIGTLEQQIQDLNDTEASTEISVNRQNALLDNLNEELAVLRLGLNSAQVSGAAALLSEAASSLRIAQQYLTLVRDISVARTLYQHSLDLLNQIDDPAISSIETMLAADMGVLNAAREIDIQGLYLRLSDVSEQVAGVSLVTVSAPSADFSQVDPQEPAAAQGFWNRVGEFLGRYFTVRRLNEPFSVPLSPEQVVFLRQNMQLQIEQAKLALLQGRTDVYQDSISSVIVLSQQNIPDTDDRKQTLLRDLRDLQTQTIILQLPRLSNALPALEAILARSAQ